MRCTRQKKYINWMKDGNIDATLLAIAGDSTNTSTSVRRGVMRQMELLNGKLVWLVRDLHTIELPLVGMQIEHFQGLRVERTIRKEWDMEDIGIAPSVRAGQKPVILREGKLRSENSSF